LRKQQDAKLEALLERYRKALQRLGRGEEYIERQLKAARNLRRADLLEAYVREAERRAYLRAKP